MNVINPAYAGADGNTSLTSSFRSQWISVKDAPETQSFFYAQPIGDKIGVGLSLVNDQVFVENQTSANAADYAEFQRVLVDTRNKNMADQLEKLVKQGGAFIAVGALHLPGDKGIVNILAQRGYKISRVLP